MKFIMKLLRKPEALSSLQRKWLKFVYLKQQKCKSLKAGPAFELPSSSDVFMLQTFFSWGAASILWLCSFPRINYSPFCVCCSSNFWPVFSNDSFFSCDATRMTVSSPWCQNPNKKCCCRLENSHTHCCSIFKAVCSSHFRVWRRLFPCWNHSGGQVSS